MLMDHFKAHIRQAYPNMWHLLAYADNFATGYFQKQGFTSNITLPRSVWAGYIKDYDESTIMHCTLMRKVDYTRLRENLISQGDALIQKIKEKSRSHIVHPGLPLSMWKEGNNLDLNPRDVPGLRESYSSSL